MTTLSTHVLDIERGVPAAGVLVALSHRDRQLAQAETNAEGRIPRLATIDPGVYCIAFDAAAYFLAHGWPAPFLKRVSVEFEVAPGAEHYHVPLLLSPYACTTYRGS